MNPHVLVLETGTPFSLPARDAEADASAALMHHLATVDDGQTILMAQVEDEVGVLSDAQDRNGPADEAWAQPAPNEAIDARRAGAGLLDVGIGGAGVRTALQ